MGLGEVEIDPIDVSGFRTSPLIASGFLGILDLLKTAKHGNEGRIYLTRFRCAPPSRAKR